MDGITSAPKTSRDFEYGGAILSGQVSRSANTIKMHRLVRDGYAKLEEFKKAIRLDQELILGSQKNFAFASAGQSDWLDMLRPLAWSFRGFQKRASGGEDSVGPVCRWFRTNTFYRKPSVTGKIEASGDELSPWLLQLNASSANGVVFLLGPYSFARLVEDSYYKNEGELALDYSNAIAKCLPKLSERGYGCILLLEPAVGYDISRKAFSNPDWMLPALAKIKNGGAKTRLGVHFPLADSKYALPIVEDSAADIVGIDAIYTDFKDVRTEKDVLLGAVDGARMGIESQEYLAGQAALFLKEAEFSGTYYLGCNDRLFDVPFEIAIEKIRALSSFKPSQVG